MQRAVVGRLALSSPYHAVLAVKGCEHHVCLSPGGRLDPVTAVLRRASPVSVNPARTKTGARSCRTAIHSPNLLNFSFAMRLATRDKVLKVGASARYVVTQRTAYHRCMDRDAIFLHVTAALPGLTVKVRACARHLKAHDANTSANASANHPRLGGESPCGFQTPPSALDRPRCIAHGACGRMRPNQRVSPRRVRRVTDAHRVKHVDVDCRPQFGLITWLR